MKVAAPYTSDSRWKDIPDEYNIVFTEKSTLQKVIDFCTQFSNKRVNIEFKTKEIDEQLILTLAKLFDNLYIKVLPEQTEKLSFFKENNFKFFFSEQLPCYSLSLLDSMLEWGCTDIYVYDILCYNLPLVAERCHNEKVNLRLVLNRIPSVSPDAGESFKSPIFSPRDMPILEQYIDVGEFDCWETEGAYNWNRFNVYYKTWFIKQNWMGNLKNLNPDINFDYPVDSMPFDFIKKKIRCGRRCGLDLQCNHCQLYTELAQELANEGVYFTKE